jgi:hypothetical protein
MKLHRTNETSMLIFSDFKEKAFHIMILAMNFFFQYWGLNSWPSSRATPLALYCEGFF